jgi:hypothetical protein
MPEPKIAEELRGMRHEPLTADRKEVDCVEHSVGPVSDRVSYGHQALAVRRLTEILQCILLAYFWRH